MFPGGRGMNPKKLNAMMRQMGISVEDIDDVEEVIVRTADKEIVFTDAAVSKMTAQGSVTWQLTGTPHERPRTPSPAERPAEPETANFTEEDVALVAEQAKVSMEKARQALIDCNGEPAEAIIRLMGE